MAGSRKPRTWVGAAEIVGIWVMLAVVAAWLPLRAGGVSGWGQMTEGHPASPRDAVGRLDVVGVSPVGGIWIRC